MVEASVKGSEDQVEAGNSQGRAEAGIGVVFGELALKSRLTQARDEGEPVGGLVVIGEVLFNHAAGRGVRLTDGECAAAVVEEDAEEGVVMLAEGVEACLQGVAGDGGRNAGLRTCVGGGAVGGGCGGRVVWIGVVASLVVVDEGRDLDHSGRVKGVQPGEGGEAVCLMLGVAQAAGVVLLIFEVIGIGVIGDLEEVFAQLGDETELILGRAVGEE